MHSRTLRFFALCHKINKTHIAIKIYLGHMQKKIKKATKSTKKSKNRKSKKKITKPQKHSPRSTTATTVPPRKITSNARAQTLKTTDTYHFADDDVSTPSLPACICACRTNKTTRCLPRSPTRDTHGLHSTHEHTQLLRHGGRSGTVPIRPSPTASG